MQKCADPLSLSYLADVCNLKCLTCVRGWEDFQQPRPKYMTLAEFKVVLSRFPKLPKLQICGFSEPTLNKDVSDMIRYAKETGVSLIPVRMESVLSKHTFASAGGLPDVAESAGAKTLAIRLLDGQDSDVAAHHVNHKPALIKLKTDLEQTCASKDIRLIMPLPGEEGVMSGCTAWSEVYVDENGLLGPCYMTRE